MTTTYNRSFKERITELRRCLKIDQLRQDNSNLLVTSYFDKLLIELTFHEDDNLMSQMNGLSTDPT